MSRHEMAKYTKSQIHTIKHALKKGIVKTTSEWVIHYASSFRELYVIHHILGR